MIWKSWLAHLNYMTISLVWLRTRYGGFIPGPWKLKVCDPQIWKFSHSVTISIKSCYSSQPRSKIILVIGRLYTEVLFCTETERTKPCASGYVLIIRPSDHTFLGKLSSTIKTISFSARLRRVLFHRCRVCNRGKNSFLHRFQKQSARYWTCLQRLLA